MLSSRGRERDRVEDADHGEPAAADPHARAGVVDPERVGRLGAEHDRRIAPGRGVEERAAPQRERRRVARSAGSAATTLIPPVSASSTSGLRRTVWPGDGGGRGDRLARRRRARSSPPTPPAAPPRRRRTTGPGATRSRFVPSWSSSASRSAFEDSEMPSTATIDATPIAIPSADSAARARRVRSPSAPVRSTSPAVTAGSPSRSSTRRGNASAIAWSCVIVTIVEPAACSSCSSAEDARAASGCRGCRSARRRTRSPAGRPAPARSPPAGARRRRASTASAATGARARPPRAPRAPAPAARPARRRVEQPGGDVVQRAHPVEQEELLEHEPDRPRAQRRQRALAERRGVVAVDLTVPRSAARACPSRAAASTCPSPDGPTTATASPACDGRARRRAAPRRRPG